MAEAKIPLGRVTNNVAEFNGLIAGIQLLREQPQNVEGPVRVRGDSQVVIGPVNGTAVCNSILRPYFLQATANMADLSPRFSFNLEHVLRRRNIDADALSNAAMDMVQAETGAQVGTVNAQYDAYRNSALAKSQSLRAVTSVVTRISGVAWHCGHVANVTSATALGGGVMQGISCRAELAPQTEAVLLAMSQWNPTADAMAQSNPFVKAHETWAASVHPEQFYKATWEKAADWKGRQQEKGTSSQRSRPAARRAVNTTARCARHDAPRCSACKRRRLPPATCCAMQHMGHEAGSLDQTRLQFRTPRGHREQTAGASAVT
ncbi:hypothetical protein DIPPA_25314 [Diplonema papillatum]|nr:hypothetical protein DIPPA_35666 [Diplonema papillatum]KAJ9445626.1 hypothetical protein DIPPA_25314 [Diplonema papillatum]